MRIIPFFIIWVKKKKIPRIYILDIQFWLDCIVNSSHRITFLNEQWRPPPQKKKGSTSCKIKELLLHQFKRACELFHMWTRIFFFKKRRRTRSQLQITSWTQWFTFTGYSAVISLYCISVTIIDYCIFSHVLCHSVNTINIALLNNSEVELLHN